jgi:Fe2+ or Zn2+ uptake regulation protein
MKYPLRNIVFEKMKASDNMTDKELLTALQRDGEDISMRDLNKVLMQLEILGLITIRWQTKDTRRIETVKAETRLQRMPGE